MLKFRVSKEEWNGTVGIRMANFSGRKICEATNITFEERDEGTISHSPPFISLSDDEAQELVNQLYAVGWYPTQAAGSAGQLDAVKFHLEDMRKLVFAA
jgi:hypothetical protein